MTIIQVNEYSKQQRQLVLCFVDKFFNALPKDFDFWIAGGAILNRVIGHAETDVDFFFKNDKEVVWLKDYLLDHGGKIIKESKYAYNMSWNGSDIDLIKLTSDSPKKCLDMFDFTVSCVAIDRNGIFYCHKDFYEHIAHRQLVVNALPDPYMTIWRIQKYIKKGFSISINESMKIAEAIAKMDRRDLMRFYTAKDF